MIRSVKEAATLPGPPDVLSYRRRNVAPYATGRTQSSLSPRSRSPVHCHEHERSPSSTDRRGEKPAGRRVLPQHSPLDPSPAVNCPPASWSCSWSGRPPGISPSESSLWPIATRPSPRAIWGVDVAWSGITPCQWTPGVRSDSGGQTASPSSPLTASGWQSLTFWALSESHSCARTY